MFFDEVALDISCPGLVVDFSSEVTLDTPHLGLFLELLENFGLDALRSGLLTMFFDESLLASDLVASQSQASRFLAVKVWIISKPWINSVLDGSCLLSNYSKGIAPDLIVCTPLFCLMVRLAFMCHILLLDSLLIAK